MEFLRGSTLFRHLLEQYSKNPAGWHFTIGPSPRDNFFDGIVSGPNEAWQLKLDSIFKPSPIVMGAKMDATPNQSANLPSYGYRKLEPEILFRLLKEVSEESDSLKSATLDRILGSLNPVVPQNNASYAEGPVVFSNKKILGMSDSQKSLDERLAAEVKRMLRESYPGYG